MRVFLWTKITWLSIMSRISTKYLYILYSITNEMGIWRSYVNVYTQYCHWGNLKVSSSRFEDVIHVNLSHHFNRSYDIYNIESLLSYYFFAYNCIFLISFISRIPSSSGLCSRVCRQRVLGLPRSLSRIPNR